MDENSLNSSSPLSKDDTDTIKTVNDEGENQEKVETPKIDDKINNDQQFVKQNDFKLSSLPF
jgi:hypothetical protein